MTTSGTSGGDRDPKFSCAEAWDCISRYIYKARERPVAAMRAGDIDCGTIVTLDEQGSVQTEAGTIRVVPTWSWLLGR